MTNLLNPYDLKDQLNPYDMDQDLKTQLNPYDLSQVCTEAAG